MSDLLVASSNWLTIEPCTIDHKTGAFHFEQIQPGVACFRLSGLLDEKLVHLFLAQMDKLKTQLDQHNQKTHLIFDTLQLDSITIRAQRAIFLRTARQDIPEGLLGIHCVINQPLYRKFIRFLRRFSPRLREILFSHESKEQALLLLQTGLHVDQSDPRGAELKHEALTTRHGSLRYFQPSPQILYCENIGVSTVEMARHMVATQGPYCAAQRRDFGQAILIMDSSKGRHCTIEAYRFLRGDVGDAAMQSHDHLIVISPRWHKGVSKIISALYPSLTFRLSVVGSLEEAFAAVRAPQVRATPLEKREQNWYLPLRWLRSQKIIADQAREIAALKQERERFLQETNLLIGDILLHKHSDDVHIVPETELNSPFEEVYESLYTLQNDYHEYFKTLQQEIDERIQAEHQAAESSHIKSRFLGNVSHELRTPLSAILGFTNLILNGSTGDVNPRQIHFLKRVKDNGLHLLALINDVLDISKIESGTLDLQFESMDMTSFLENLLEPLRMTAIAKHIQLHLEIDPHAPPSLLVDADRLRQIISNLVNNALKFTDKGSVSIHYRSGTSTAFPVVLEVKDTGIGISKADQKKVFEDFVQVHHSAYAGVGLGLSICASLAQLLGYQIELESELGQGSCFRILMPLVGLPL